MRYLLSYVHIKNDSIGMCEIFGMNIIEMIKCFRNMENACGGCRAQPRFPSTKNLYYLCEGKMSNIKFTFLSLS